MEGNEVRIFFWTPKNYDVHSSFEFYGHPKFPFTLDQSISIIYSCKKAREGNKKCEFF